MSVASNTSKPVNPESEAVVRPLLAVIWDDTEHIEKWIVDSVMAWKCKGCGKVKKYLNASKQ